MWKKIMVELEQEIFRTSIRDFSADNPIKIYLFKPDFKIIELLKQRFIGCQIIEDHNVPLEFIHKTAEKKFNKVQSFVKWLNEWDGKEISIKKIKEMFHIKNKYWERINSRSDIKNLKTQKNVKTIRRSNVYYWIAE